MRVTTVGFSETSVSDVSIYAIDLSGNCVTDCPPSPVFPVAQAHIRTGELACYLSKFAEVIENR